MKKQSTIKRPSRRTIAYGTAALLAFGLLYLATFRGRAAEQQPYQVQIVAFGDSVFTDIGELVPIPDRLAALLDMDVYNAAMGGTCAARLETERRLDYTKGSMSLVGLARSVLARDFDVQLTARIPESNAERFPETVEGLSQVDFSRVETVLIQHGINDYHAGTPIEDPRNPYDEYTYLGALRNAVRDLRKANPGIRIVLITPTYSWYLEAGQTCEEADNGGGRLEDYVDAELALAKELGVEALDLYHDFYPHKTWEDWALHTIDGIHPNETGRDRITQAIAQILEPEKAF
ncbi:SGNH/GDSL hydrolase family protein [uncultured Acetatifactor sp.]|uniref:SGNH/GDSL hydrolase family protein n=1 Tax=uncultured Acetatifactor sp. TaxID=1671927 RepID=UPI0026217C89|nr:SGNH/GDSL hydrolase family protein [uncultured Acetatifactor sp.]